MKTKRITLYIELFLFVLGIGLAIYFGITDKFDLKISSLISNICIGISTGGLVAFLVAIPSYLTDTKSIKSYLFENARLLYAYTYQLVYLIDDAVSHPNTKIYEKMCNHNSDLIISQATKLSIVDNSLFMCKTKNKQLNLFTVKMYDVPLKKLKSVNQLQLAINRQELAMRKGELPSQELTHRLFAIELMNVKTEVRQIIDLIDNTVRVLYDKKSIDNWDANIQNIKNSLIGTSLFTD